jgi:hypothetical protein
MNYARRRSDFFSYLSGLLYRAHRWCEWQSIKIATRPFTPTADIFEGPDYGNTSTSCVVSLLLDHNNPEIREALCRGYLKGEAAAALKTTDTLVIEPPEDGNGMVI